MVPTIMVLRPRKKDDPTEYVYLWGRDAIALLKSKGYNVIDISENDVTYDNVYDAIIRYNPRVVITFSHGCPTSIIGQNGCVITRKFSIDELVERDNFLQIVQPLRYQSGCVHTCKSMPDPCSPLCVKDTNVGLLKGRIVIAIACYTGSQLAKCAVKAGADAYLGYTNLLLFPVDDIKSENIFKEVHLEFIKKLADGKTIGEAEKAMNNYENNMIRLYKKTKYISLPLLWNKIAPDSNENLVPNRIILGNKDITI